HSLLALNAQHGKAAAFSALEGAFGQGQGIDGVADGGGGDAERVGERAGGGVVDVAGQDGDHVGAVDHALESLGVVEADDVVQGAGLDGGRVVQDQHRAFLGG